MGHNLHLIALIALSFPGSSKMCCQGAHCGSGSGVPRPGVNVRPSDIARPPFRASCSFTRNQTERRRDRSATASQHRPSLDIAGHRWTSLCRSGSENGPRGAMPSAWSRNRPVAPVQPVARLVAFARL